MENTYKYRTCSKQFRDMFVELYPAAAKNERAMRYAWHALNADLYGWSRGSIFFLDKGTWISATNKKYSAKKFLQEMFDLFGHGVLSYKPIKHNKFNMHVDPQWPEEILRSYRLDASSFFHDNRVYWISGKKYGRKSAVNVNSSNFAIRTEQARDILSYLDMIPARSLKPVNIEMAFAHIRETRSYDERKLYSAYMRLKHLIDIPKSEYIQGVRSNRLFCNYGLQGLPQDIRSITHPDFIDLDLKQCHLAIAAKLLDLADIIELLYGRYDIWYNIYNGIGLDQVTIPQEDKWPIYPPYRQALDDETLCSDAAKPNSIKSEDSEKVPPTRAIDVATKATSKQALYALLFGADQRSVKAALTRALSHQHSLVFFNNKVISRIADARDERLSQLAQQFGSIQEARSAWACECQGVELEIIHQLYVAANRSKDFRIVLHSHDGVSIVIDDIRRKDQVINRLKKTVSEYCRQIGVPTSLEVKKPAPVYVPKIDLFNNDWR